MNLKIDYSNQESLNKKSQGQGLIKKFIIFLILLLIIGGGVWFIKSKQQPSTSTTDEGLLPAEDYNNPMLQNKKALLIIASKDFKDEEYFKTKEVLEAAGVITLTASDKTGTAQGSDGGEVAVDLNLKNVQARNFDAVIFIGGSGALSSLDNKTSYNIALNTLSSGKILGAICIAPVILAKSKALESKKATVWNSILDKSAIRILKENDVIFVDEPVVKDSNIITANGPAAATAFGQEIVKALADINGKLSN